MGSNLGLRFVNDLFNTASNECYKYICIEVEFSNGIVVNEIITNEYFDKTLSLLNNILHNNLNFEHNGIKGKILSINYGNSYNELEI